MPERDRSHYLFNGRELGRLIQLTHRHTLRVIERSWRGYLVRFAHTNPFDTRLDPHFVDFASDVAPVIDKIYIRKSVLDAMILGAWEYPNLETGEALVGVVPPYQEDEIGAERASNEQAVYILGTIAPNESTIREWGTVQMGDEDQFDRFLWLAENWYEDHLQNERWGQLSLQHLGDWHKQPSRMTVPSRGDYQSAKEILRDVHWRLPFILQPIVTLPNEVNQLYDREKHDDFLMHTDDRGRQGRVDFWYLSKSLRRYEKPTNVEVVSEEANEVLPELAQIPWNLSDQQRMDFEEFSLENDRRNFEALYFNTDGIPPLEYCLVVELSDGINHVLVATQFDFPMRPPVAWYIEMRPEQEAEGLLERVRDAWPSREPIGPAPGWRWSSDTSISTYIGMIEMQLDVKPARDPTENGGVSE